MMMTNAKGNAKVWAYCIVFHSSIFWKNEYKRFLQIEIKLQIYVGLYIQHIFFHSICDS